MEKCNWAVSHPILEKYHDEEWGIPIHDDQKLFEFLCLESAQAGLSWLTVLKKREAYKKAFDDFDYFKISKYSDSKIQELMLNPGIIRNRLKILAFINNAAKFMEIQKEIGSFNEYIWRFVNHKPIQSNYVNQSDIPASTELSDKISKDLKSRGFKFVGSTIIYAHMQATGMVNDHLVSCYRYNDLYEKH